MPGSAFGGGPRAALQRHLVENDVLCREESPKLLERALAPHCSVMRVLERPELVVGHGEQDREAVLLSELRQDFDEWDEAGQVLDGLEAGDDLRAVGGVLEELGSDAVDVALRGQVGLDGYDFFDKDLAPCVCE